MKKILFLFTKQFPYGNQETYIEYELPYMERFFEKVYVIPHDEFQYIENNRLSEDETFQIIKINKELKKLQFNQIIKREIVALKILLGEIFWGREKWNHIKYFFKLLGQLRHLYSSAFYLDYFIKTQKQNENEIIFYTYWLHRGSIISGILKNEFKYNSLLISRAHSVDLFHKDWGIKVDGKKIFLPFEFYKIKVSDKIYSISNLGYKHFIKNFPKYKHKFYTSYLGVFKPNENKNKIINNQFIVLSCSNVTKNKRIEFIPDIISELKGNFIWYHIGDGDKNIIDEINNKIKKYNLQEKCFLLGYKTKDEVKNFYETHSVNLFINLSLVEGIPVSLMEAASYGVPMIATDVGGNNEIVNNDNGLLIPKNFNIKDIANWINNLMKDQDKWKKLSENAYIIFEEKFNADKNFLEFYLSLQS